MAIGEKTRRPSAASVRDRAIEGVLTRIKQGVATGWAADSSDATFQVRLEAFVNGNLIASLTADRSGLERDGEVGAPNCGFKFKIPDDFADGDRHMLSIRVAQGGGELRGSPQPFSMRSKNPGQADSALASDQRAAFLMERLLDERRHGLNRRLELIKELAALKIQLGDIPAATDIQAALDVLLIKLDRA